jgi:hypothetical protein
MSSIGEDALDLWEQNPDKVPQGSTALIKPEPIKEPTKEGDWDAIKDFGLIALGMLLIF